MVDFQTYRQLHSTDYAFKREYKSIEDATVVRMDPSMMEANNPPPSPDIYAFPDKLVAYNLRSKNWGKYICDECTTTLHAANNVLQSILKLT